MKTEGRLIVGTEDEPGLSVVLIKPRSRCKVAIIVDDVGFGGSSTTSLLTIKAPLALAILPFYRGSVSAATHAGGRDFDVMLHMPMEPKRYKNNVRQKVAILANMAHEKIIKRLKKALDSLPGEVTGVNNHMGSRITEDSTSMAIILQELKRRGLFFVDSVTTRKSCAYDISRQLGLASGRRNFEFIDNKPSEAYAVEQFNRLIKRSKSKSSLICIMHDRPHSVAALQRMLPSLRKNGIELTYVSHLLDRTETGRRGGDTIARRPN